MLRVAPVDRRRPRGSNLTARCDSSLTFADLFAGTRFADDAFQADFARSFVRHEIGVSDVVRRQV